MVISITAESSDFLFDDFMSNQNYVDLDFKTDSFVDVDVVRLPDIKSELAAANARAFMTEQQLK